MIDLKFIRENPEKVKKSSLDKGIEIDVDKIVDLDSQYRSLSTKLQEIYAQRNVASKERDIETGKGLKAEIDNQEGKLNELKEELSALLSAIPNPSKDDVVVGPDESGNEVVRKHKEPTKFSFVPKDHVELGKSLDIIDIDRAAKVSGARFAYLKNEGAVLEFAVVQFAFEALIKEGFIPVIPPTLIKKDTMRLLGYMENGGEEDMFHVEKDGMVLVGTAEQSIVPMHKDELFFEKNLPKRYVGYSSSFRREAGSYGRDTKGILRVHEFHKVEMVSYVAEGQDDKEHEYLLGLEENFFQALDIPYQVVKMCTGDLGFPAARKYDIEAWIPTQNKYREVTSASTTSDFQSRRLNIKYQSGADKKYVNILNGTAFAIGRTLIAILENYQQEDGSVMVPEALRKYTGFEKILPKNP